MNFIADEKSETGTESPRCVWLCPPERSVEVLSLEDKHTRSVDVGIDSVGVSVWPKLWDNDSSLKEATEQRSDADRNLAGQGAT